MDTPLVISTYNFPQCVNELLNYLFLKFRYALPISLEEDGIRGRGGWSVYFKKSMVFEMRRSMFELFDYMEYRHIIYKKKKKIKE